MMLWLYNFPDWLLGSVIVGMTLGLALLGHWLWRRCLVWTVSEERTGLAMTMLGVVSMLLSLLLAFSSVSVWEAYAGAAGAATAEAGVAGELVRDLAVYGGPAATATRETVRAYLESVIAEDWPAMAAGGRSESTSHKFNDIFRRAAAIEPRTAREEILLREIWDKTNELNLHRRGRLEAAEGSAVPVALWGTMLCATALTFILFYLLPFNRFNALLLAVYAAALGLMFYLIIAMDRPFAGTVSVSPESYASALRSMQRWDAEPGGSAVVPADVTAMQ